MLLFFFRDLQLSGYVLDDKYWDDATYCLNADKCYDNSNPEEHCSESLIPHTYLLPSPDCVQKAEITEPIFFNDGGVVKVNQNEICSRDCSAEGNKGVCDPDEPDITELVRENPEEAKLTLVNENNEANGKTLVKLKITWGDPDNSEGQCETCLSLCASGNPWCTSNIPNRREWIEDEDEGNYCCGDDNMAGNPVGSSTDNDNPDRSKIACQQCPKSRDSDIVREGGRVWLGDDPEIFSALTWNKCCGDDEVRLAYGETDDPDRSLSSCNKCKIGNLNKNTPTKRSWDSSVTEPTQRCCGDDNGDDPDASLIQCEGKGDQEPCPIGDVIEGRIWADAAKADPRNQQAAAEGQNATVNPDAGCCGDVKTEKWCAGATVDGGCFNGQFYGPGYEDIDNKEIDTEGLMCTTCTTRKTSSGETLPGAWFPAIESASSAGSVVPVISASAGTPCCGDDPGETWCINQNKGCYSVGDITDVVEEPDENAWLCVSCAGIGMTPATRAWDPVSVGSNCCGDDAEDCGEQPSDGRLCGDIDGEFSWSWIIAAEEEGNIKELPCNNKQYLATDEKWLGCGKSGWEGDEGSDEEESDDEKSSGSNKLVEDIGPEPHDYLCVKGEIVECAGSGSPNSDGDAGVQKMLGESQKAGGDVYYCSGEGKWKTNLDNDQETCEAAVDEDENPLIWTGKYCCSEAEDYPEYYNDEGSLIGACWKSGLMMNGQAVDYPGNGIGDIIVSNGKFEGCKVAANNFNSENDAYLNITDTQTDETLINDHNYCSTLDIKFSPDSPGLPVWCSYQEEWKEFSVFSSRPYLSSIIWRDNDTQNAECCPSNQCWIGNYSTIITDSYDILDGCAEDMSKLAGEDSLFNAPDGNQYRCVKGSWEIPNVKLSPIGRRGFCPQESMCLVDPYGDSKYNGNTSINAFPVCINDGQYLDSSDFYCKAGDWTSRTSFAAQQMTKIITSNYTIACGSSDEVLNFVSYFSNQSLHMNDYLYYANSICVMKTDDLVVIGTSLNRPVDSPFASMLEAIGKPRTYCDNAKINDGSFKVCSGSDAYYNHKLGLLIFSKSPISFAGEGVWEEFLNKMAVIENEILPEVPSETYGDMGIFRNRRYYSGVFLDRHAGREVAGLLESPTLGGSVVASQYSDFDSDICQTISKFNTDNGKSIYCSQLGVNAYVMTNDVNSAGIFSELTKELRVK
ncbi:hypothetical protein HY638_00305 [Candidatus Woesearchaeota archaeon]|nr:hypothetical protein [Candidatus Woesearchaeota archaeon]